MGRKVIVLGSNGMLGRHLVSELLAGGYEVIASDIHEQAAMDVEYIRCDLTDIQQVAELMSVTEPEQIFFCVGVYSTKNREVLERINAYTFSNVLARSKSVCRRFYVVSSASVYGLPPAKDLPVTEDYEGFPTSNYGLSKYLLEGIARYDERTVIIRPSNFLGKGLSEYLLPGKLVSKVKEKAGDEIEIELYNETSVRDFIDVRDFCRIMRELIELEDIPKVLNVSTGRGVSVREMVDELETVLGKRIRTRIIGEEPEPRYRAHVQSNRRLEEYLSKHGIVLDELLSHDLQSSLRYMVNQ